MTVPPGRLLIVDDEPDVTELLVSYFTERGYTASTAHHGGDAIMLASVERPDVMLLDILMPGADGVEVLRRIRAIDATIPIIMVTGNADEVVARDTLTIGAFDYVAKPFNLDVLDAAVRAAVVASRTGEWRTPSARAPRGPLTRPLKRLQVIDGVTRYEGPAAANG